MADSKKLRALKAFCDVIADNVRGAATGSTYDIEGRVYRGRMFFGPEDDVPAVAILDNPDPDRWPSRTGMDDEAETRKQSWYLLVQGWAPDEDNHHPTDGAFNLMADVQQAIAKIMQDPYRPGEAYADNPYYMLGGLVTGMTMEPGVVRPPVEKPTDKAFFWMRVSLQFVEDTNNPYA